MSVRNLRLREDRAKYLINLDTESAFYDPKTRSMRDNPNPDAGGGGGGSGGGGGGSGSGTGYQGDNAWRASGMVSEMADAQLFAWDAAARGAEVHLQSNPTQLEFMRKEFAARKASLASAQAAAVAAKYGAREEQEDATLTPDFILGAREGAMAEYSRDGRLLPPPGAARAAAGGVSTGGVVRSSFDEDVWPGNHTSVWGSWYDVRNRSWGYACCHATLRSAYCAGRLGIAAADAEAAAADAPPPPPQAPMSAVAPVAGVKRERPIDGDGRDASAIDRHTRGRHDDSADAVD